MPVGLQAKLLRVLQERKVRRVGSLDEVEIELKLISSVNKEPHQAVEEGALRSDLLYRLGVVFIRIPPLCQRLEDLENLICHFLNKCNRVLGKQITAVSSDVMDVFRSYPWPGNVRELEHVIEGAMNLVKDTGTIERKHLSVHIGRLPVPGPQGSAPTSRPVEPCVEKLPEHRPRGPVRVLFPSASKPKVSQKSLPESQAANEIESIRNALATTKGNAAQAARMLGLSPQLLHYKMKKYRIDRNDFTV
jgi:arginine utilization regulatory protein